VSGLTHLAGRFFAVLGARALSPAEQDRVAGWLRPAERSLFWGQPAADQRHALECALAVAAAAPGRPDLLRAALLHDVGKRHAGLGAAGRSLATTADFLRLPAGARGKAYLDHGPRGAAELAAAGAEPLVVSYARHHHLARPAEFPATDWQVLLRADDA